MSFQEVGGAKKYKPWTQMQPGEIVTEGWFLRTTQGKFGPVYEVLEPSGQIFSINNSGQLKYKAGLIEPGDYIQVKYLGKSECKSGAFKGKLANDVSVQVDATRFRFDLFIQYEQYRDKEKPVPLYIQEAKVKHSVKLPEPPVATAGVIADEEDFQL